MGSGNVLEVHYRVFTTVIQEQISEVRAAGGEDELVRLEGIGLCGQGHVSQLPFLKAETY